MGKHSGDSFTIRDKVSKFSQLVTGAMNRPEPKIIHVLVFIKSEMPVALLYVRGTQRLLHNSYIRLGYFSPPPISESSSKTRSICP